MPLGHRAAHDPVDLGAVHGLLLQQQADQLIKLSLMGPDQLDGGLLGLAQQPGHLLVDDGLRSLGERAAGEAGAAAAAQEHRAALGIAHRADGR